jgi:hypothetical protein
MKDVEGSDRGLFLLSSYLPGVTEDMNKTSLIRIAVFRAENRRGVLPNTQE